MGIEQLVLSPARLDRSIPKTPVSVLRQIRTHGQLQPVVVRSLAEHQYEVLANAESWLAVQRAGLHQVEIMIRAGVDDAEAEKLVNRHIELDPIAEAEWFRSCLNTAGQGGKPISVTQLAHSLSLGRSYVAHALRLLELSDSVQQAVRTGALKVGHAKAILSVKNASDQTKFALQIIRQHLSVRQAENVARSIVAGVQSDTTKSTTTQHLEKALSEIVGSTVQIDEREGKLTIDYGKNYNVLDGILARLGYAERDTFDAFEP
ncbi:MAG: ParB/RepB/Spo0J family partition protein [Granulosicoccaceae bacterium]